MTRYIPPFKITPQILRLSQEIAHTLGKMEGQRRAEQPVRLRRDNSIKTIQASLAIEGNTLTVDQITALLDGHRVIAPSKEILEVQNAIRVYEKIEEWDALNIIHLKQAHSQLMEQLIEESGCWRTGNVGIIKGNELAHLAPPAGRVHDLMGDLFHFTQNANFSWLIKACVFHYEFEFIHPFADGNGRMGRLWQQLLLIKEHRVFRYLPIEVLIKENQAQYYEALHESDVQGESTPFLEFSLSIIAEALQVFAATWRGKSHDVESRMNHAQVHLSGWFSRKDYMTLHRDISAPTASRDLKWATDKNLILSSGRTNQVRYKFKPTGEEV